jgi:hypothetical protein
MEMTRIVDPICTRRIQATGRRKKIATITIGRPTKRGRNWVCQFHISNVGMPAPAFAYGVDSLQALTMAFEGARVKLKDSGDKWICRGETAIPRLVPHGFGRSFTRRLEDYIDAEIESFAAEAERRATGARSRA